METLTNKQAQALAILYCVESFIRTQFKSEGGINEQVLRKLIGARGFISILNQLATSATGTYICYKINETSKQDARICFELELLADPDLVNKVRCLVVGLEDKYLY